MNARLNVSVSAISPVAQLAYIYGIIAVRGDHRVCEDFTSHRAMSIASDRFVEHGYTCTCFRDDGNGFKSYRRS